jgi:hypothetical protein
VRRIVNCKLRKITQQGKIGMPSDTVSLPAVAQFPKARAKRISGPAKIAVALPPSETLGPHRLRPLPLLPSPRPPNPRIFEKHPARSPPPRRFRKLLEGGEREGVGTAPQLRRRRRRRRQRWGRRIWTGRSSS